MDEKNRVGQLKSSVIKKILWIGGFLPCQSILEELERTYNCQVDIVSNYSDISVCGIIELLNDDQYIGVATMGNNSDMRLPFIMTGKPQCPGLKVPPIPEDPKVIMILPHGGELPSLGIPNNVVERYGGVKYVTIPRW